MKLERNALVSAGNLMIIKQELYLLSLTVPSYKNNFILNFTLTSCIEKNIHAQF